MPIEWHDKEAWVSEAIVDLEDDELIGYLSTGDHTGVYAPFGWPVAMVEAVASYTNLPSEPSGAGLFLSGRSLWPMRP